MARGETVTVVDDFNDFYDPAIKHRNLASVEDRVGIHQLDIRDADRLGTVFEDERPDAIIHLAARAGIRPSLADPARYTSVNIVGTQNLLELARRYQVPKFVFGSSSSVYGIYAKIPFREDDPVQQPISPYAATKLAGETLGHVYHHLYGLDLVCLRFFTVYGPRQRPDLAIHKFTRAILAGDPIDVYGDGSSQRDYTYIDDIVQGIEACLDRTFGHEIINLGESRTVALSELIQIIENVTGQKAHLNRLPAQAGDVPITSADISKARRLLDYQPSTDISEGVPRFVEWFQSAHPPDPARCLRP